MFLVSDDIDSHWEVKKMTIKQEMSYQVFFWQQDMVKSFADLIDTRCSRCVIQVNWLMVEMIICQETFSVVVIYKRL